MNSKKKLVIAGFFLLLAIRIEPAVAYASGYAQGEILAIHDHYAFLLIAASQPERKPANKLLAVDYMGKKILWEIETIGSGTEFVQAQGDRVVTIEGNHLVARNIEKGSIKWEMDLINISTNRDDMIPIENADKNNHSALIGPIYNKCINDPGKAEYFDYEIFLPDPNLLILFRVARIGYDGPLSMEKDFLQINMQKGELTKKGCYHLLGFSNEEALITDYRVLYRLNEKEFVAIPGSEKIWETRNDPFSLIAVIPYISHLSNWYISEHLKIFVSRGNSDVPEILNLFEPKLYFKSCQIALVGDYLVRFTDGYLSDKKQDPKKQIYWTESFDLHGNCLKVIEEKASQSFRSELLGQTKDHCLIIKKGSLINLYSMPEIRLITSFEIPESKSDWYYKLDRYNRTLMVAESQNRLVVGYVTGNLWISEGSMHNKKDKNTVTFKFYNFKNRKAIWSFKQKIIYYKIKARH